MAVDVDLLGLANRALRRSLVSKGVTSLTADVDGHQVHAYRLDGGGHGPPALLVHGLGSSANAYARLMVPLARRFRTVWALDVPGNGFSPMPARGPLTLREQLEVVASFARSHVKAPAFVVGNSLGGAITLTLAGEHPQLVRALALISPAGARVAPERLKALVDRFDVKTRAEARAMTRRLFHRPPLPMLLFAGQLRRLYANPSVTQVIREVKPDDAISEALLAGLSMPVLLLWGKSERLLPYEGLDYFRAHLPPHAQIFEVPGFGHIPQMERPRDVVQRLVAFADQQGL